MSQLRTQCDHEAVKPLRGYRAYLLTLGILWGLPALLVWYLHATLPTENANGQCTGIGFGCTLSPADGVVFAALYAAPVLLLIGLAACAVIAVSRARRERHERRRD